MRQLRIAFWLVTAIAIGWGIGTVPLFEPPVGTLEGRVVARDSGRPLLAQVVLSPLPKGDSVVANYGGRAPHAAPSDADGRFSFPGVSTGVYWLEISSPGHYLERFHARVTEGRTTSVDIEVPRRPSWVELVVHHNLLYPGEPVSVAARGLTLTPSYRLDVYRINRWERVSEYEARQYQKALAAAIAAGDLTLVSSADHQPRHIDPEGVYYDRFNLNQLPLGRYLLVATGETGSRSTERLTVSRLALLVKSDQRQAVAYVTDLKSGTPIAGARVTGGGATAIKGGVRRLARGLAPGPPAVTDANGLARVAQVPRPAAYSASVGEDVVTLSVWQSQRENEAFRLFAFTDRPIYRPGDLVRFKGVLRAREGLGYRVPGLTSIAVTVTDEDGIEIYRSRYRTNSQGSFAGFFTLPKVAKAGTYTMTSTIHGGRPWGEPSGQPPHAALGAFHDETFLTVASYLKPELQLSARPLKPQYVRGELAHVEIQATYYFGAPAADVEVRWTLSRSPHYPAAEADAEWEGDYGEGGGEMVSEGSGKTDADGRLRLTLPSRLAAGQQGEEENPYFDHEFHLEVWSTSDVGGEAQASTSYLVTRGRFSLSISPQRYVLTPGQPTGVKVEARDFSGHPVADLQVTVTLLTETPPREQESGRVKRTVLASWSVLTDRDGIANTSVTPPKQGEFVIEGVARDSDHHQIAAREHLWAAAEAFWEFGERWSELSIVTDRREYSERDHVRLLVTSQHAGPGLLCLEGDRLYDVRPVALRRGANLIEFELKPDYVPNLFVWVGQIYDKRLHRAEHEIRVSREMRRLMVRVKPGQAEYRPGKTAACEVQVTDAKGQPAPAEVAVGVVDEGIYALAEDNVADPAEFFYGRRYNSVETSFEPEGYYLGGSDKAPTNIEVRRRFEDTAFWSPQVLTDSQGRTRMEFKLPDNLTSWRVTVRAVSTDTRGGTGRASFKVNKPLMVRLDLPRFATQGDRFRVSAYVHNDTGTEQQVKLHSWARGLKLESRDQALRVPAHQVVREDWWVTATGLDGVVIGALGRALGPASGVSSTLNDAVEMTLPVNPLTRTQFDAWSGRTEATADVLLPLRQDAYRDRARVTISVAPSVAASLFSSLGYLIRYPYGCVEQTISSFLPGLYVHDLLRARGLGGSPLAKSIPPIVRGGLFRLSALRREEDGWGWGRWGELDVWMTSYALLAIEDAKRAGYQTPPEGMARERLESALRSNRFEYPDDVAFAAYMLARLKSESTVQTLLTALNSPKLSGRGRALCALAYFELGDTVEAHRVMAEVWRTAKREGDWTYWTGLQSQECAWWDGGATVEATAWSLQAALRADPKDRRAASIAGWLLHARIGDHWVSTRDTAIAVAALSTYLKGFDEPNPAYTALVNLNGEDILRQTYSSDLKSWREVSVEIPATKLRPGVNKLVLSRGPGSGRLYYLVNLRQQVRIREDQKTAEGQIFQIQREYYKLARGTAAGSLGYGPAARPDDTYQENDRVQVRLTVNSSQRLRYVLIEDPLPAGLEPSARGDVGFMDSRSWWVDNDVRDDRVSFYLDWLPAGKSTVEYVVSARTPGRFHAPPPNGFAMYQPKINAVGDQAILAVRP